MSMKTARMVVGAAVALLAVGCATRGPIEERPPIAEVAQLESTVMTPEVVRFEARVVVHNRMRDSMDFDRVDYAVDLFDSELFNDSFDGLKRTSGGGRLTITLPFQIAVADIAASAVDVLAEESMRITFRGAVYPASESGFGPLPFVQTVEIPIPRMPEVTFRRTEGVPFSEMFRIVLDVRNRNTYPLSVESVESYLEINEREYPLLYSVESTQIGARATGTVILQMEHTPGRTLSMILNTMQSDDPTFSIGGSITARTQYGWIYIPVRIDDRPAGEGGR